MLRPASCRLETCHSYEDLGHSKAVLSVAVQASRLSERCRSTCYVGLGLGLRRRLLCRRVIIIRLLLLMMLLLLLATTEEAPTAAPAAR
eukprot:COSAG01_NODE_25643_length_738_cov_1.594679_1_plen_89_part_00